MSDTQLGVGAPVPPAAPTVDPDGSRKFTITVPAASGVGGLSIGSLVVYLLMGGGGADVLKPHAPTPAPVVASEKYVDSADYDEHVWDFETLESEFEELEETVDDIGDQLRWGVFPAAPRAAGRAADLGRTVRSPATTPDPPPPDKSTE